MSNIQLRGKFFYLEKAQLMLTIDDPFSLIARGLIMKVMKQLHNHLFVNIKNYKVRPT